MNKWKRNLKGLVRKRPFAFFDIFLYQVLNNNFFQRAAGLSYFLILAIFPFFIALLHIVNYVNVNYLSSIISLINQLPPEIKEIILSFMKDLEINSSGTLLSVSLIGSVYIASNGIRQVMRTINEVLNITEKRNIFAQMGLSFLMTVGLFIVIILILITQVLGNNFLNFLFNLLQFPELSHFVTQLLMRLIPLAFMFFIFYCLYYFSPKWPRGKHPISSITLLSALFATVGVILTTAIFSFYVSRFSNYSNTYGSLAGMIIFLVWLYLFGLILLFGGAVQASLYKLYYDGAHWPRKETMFQNIVSAHDRIC
ncbi:MAG: YihY/virulence factor BrkB family protein [Peptoniphilus sp.]|nr:YihY/virulence factor BrkB family protein [Peptoniphilus sp.]MDD7363018.1 YihY/virulence factor BrkB family protein [Bacillota bacterium]MDY6045283.1 YihY/virulence factor BrkB family protein [Peptoniphilus sp.]